MWLCAATACPAIAGNEDVSGMIGAMLESGRKRNAAMSLGPVMVDLAGTELSEAERARLLHPQVGGVILFSRNYASPPQLARLTAEIHDVSVLGHLVDMSW